MILLHKFDFATAEIHF